MPRTNAVVRAAPLPATNEHLTVATKPPKIQDHLKMALTNGLYTIVRPYYESIDDEHAVTGSWKMDRIVGAQAAQKYGVEHDLSMIQNAKLNEVYRGLNVAWRALRDENGNRIDRKSRIAAALAHHE